MAVDRARESWDGLTGGPPADGRYSEIAAAAIVQLALALWADVAAAIGDVE